MLENETKKEVNEYDEVDGPEDNEFSNHKLKGLKKLGQQNNVTTNDYNEVSETSSEVSETRSEVSENEISSSTSKFFAPPESQQAGDEPTLTEKNLAQLNSSQQKTRKYDEVSNPETNSQSDKSEETLEEITENSEKKSPEEEDPELLKLLQEAESELKEALSGTNTPPTNKNIEQEEEEEEERLNNLEDAHINLKKEVSNVERQVPTPAAEETELQNQTTMNVEQQAPTPAAEENNVAPKQTEDRQPDDTRFPEQLIANELGEYIEKFEESQNQDTVAKTPEPQAPTSENLEQFNSDNDKNQKSSDEASETDSLSYRYYNPKEDEVKNPNNDPKALEQPSQEVGKHIELQNQAPTLTSENLEPFNHDNDKKREEDLETASLSELSDTVSEFSEYPKWKDQFSSEPETRTFFQKIKDFLKALVNKAKKVLGIAKNDKSEYTAPTIEDPDENPQLSTIRGRKSTTKTQKTADQLRKEQKLAETLSNSPENLKGVKVENTEPPKNSQHTPDTNSSIKRRSINQDWK